MKKNILGSLLTTVIILSACQSNHNNENQQDSLAGITLSETEQIVTDTIPFTILQHYFVKNTYDNTDFDELVIESKDEFELIFGPAAVMGKEGKPTVIDFEKEYVLAIIGTPTNVKTTIYANRLKNTEKDIIFDYKIDEGEKMTYSIQPMLAIVVDKAKQKNVIFNKLF